MDLIKQGAEARIYRSEFEGKPCLIKERFEKKYRLPELDQQLTKERIKAEAKALTKCKDAGVPAPKLYQVDFESRHIIMEEITAPTLKEILQKNEFNENTTRENLAQLVGTSLAKIHRKNLIHGDLTTSNMLYKSESKELYLLDFGLSFTSTSAEDKAVDLYVLERAIISTHTNAEDFFSDILKYYKQEVAEMYPKILKRLEEVRTRGRKRLMVG